MTENNTYSNCVFKIRIRLDTKILSVALIDPILVECLYEWAILGFLHT